MWSLAERACYLLDPPAQTRVLVLDCGGEMAHGRLACSRSACTGCLPLSESITAVPYPPYINWLVGSVPRISRMLLPRGHFGDIWCQFVSFGPAPHIYQQGERVRGPRCAPFTAAIGATWLSVRQGSEVPGNMPHPICLHIDPTARSGTEGEPHPETRVKPACKAGCYTTELTKAALVSSTLAPCFTGWLNTS